VRLLGRSAQNWNKTRFNFVTLSIYLMAGKRRLLLAVKWNVLFRISQFKLLSILKFNLVFKKTSWHW
jgi:hypothetical protein